MNNCGKSSHRIGRPRRVRDGHLRPSWRRRGGRSFRPILCLLPPEEGTCCLLLRQPSSTSPHGIAPFLFLVFSWFPPPPPPPPFPFPFFRCMSACLCTYRLLFAIQPTRRKELLCKGGGPCSLAKKKKKKHGNSTGQLRGGTIYAAPAADRLRAGSLVHKEETSRRG